MKQWKTKNKKIKTNTKKTKNRQDNTIQVKVSSRWTIQTINRTVRIYLQTYFSLSFPCLCLHTCKVVYTCTVVKNGFTILSLHSKTYFSHHICSRCPMSNAAANPKGFSMHLARSWLTKPGDPWLNKPSKWMMRITWQERLSIRKNSQAFWSSLHQELTSTICF